MKFLSVLSVACVLMASNAFAAGFQEATVSPRGGFVGGAENVVTVRQVREMRDDVPVIVQGKIVQRTGNEKYLFEDSTGTITVEIDDDAWRGHNVTPTDTIKIYGEVDAGLFKTEIDVDYVEKQ